MNRKFKRTAFNCNRNIV